MLSLIYGKQTYRPFETNTDLLQTQKVCITDLGLYYRPRSVKTELLGNPAISDLRQQ